MVHPRPGPAGGGMTVVAGVGTGDMRRTLTGGRSPVMAGVAGTRYRRMVHSRTRPVACCCMAIIAGIGAGYMVLILAWERNAVMTSRTFTDR